MAVRRRLDIQGPVTGFITTTAQRWLPVFKDAAIASNVVRQLGETVEFFRAGIVAYVVMSNHVHFIVHVDEYPQIPKLVGSFKSLCAKRLESKTWRDTLTIEGTFRLWMPRYDEFIITSMKTLKTKVEYVHNNPVKAGLLRTAEDWPYSSAADWAGTGRGLISIRKDIS